MEEEIGYDQAVEVAHLNKSYGSGKNKLKVLDNMQMRVATGAIYGLLGPSGCGKTTLLRCIIGRLSWESGTIVTLGKKPGTIGHPVPGSSVGYMPQELALFQDFTISETLSYFGRLHKMTSKRVKERMTFLLDFLHLPDKGRLIRQLSGGQQRRTSFAIALLQEPQLLILDEPTVGVDPLLRQRIWEHLLDIAHSSNITIIITTHYVEEARQAHMVGLMRNGRLLAECSPEELIEKHNLPTLEDVFLELCERDQIGDIEQNEGCAGISTQVCYHDWFVISINQINFKSREARELRQQQAKRLKKFFFPSASNVLALFIKNLTILRRQIGFLLFEFMLPAMQIVMFCLCIGRDPFNLNVAVVNNETCHPPPVPLIPFAASCAFLQHIDSHYINDFQHRYNEARESVESGDNWGVISIGSNFTQDLMIRITFFMATGLTAMSFVLERKQGLLDRSFVAGVTNMEVMIGHISTQFLVMLVQVSLLLVFAIAVFHVVAEGSLVLVVLLTLFQGLVGMALGLLISTICIEETSAIQCALGSVYPNMLLSGIIWPLESMPMNLRYVSYCLPMTYAAEAMRCILARGWGLTYMPVWRGFLMSIGWGWILMALSAIALAIRKF
ncbi:hypothetical protein CAPTEDRAFT_162923 [Capitella teleta]|uniref:Uncharacterized protein n=1 Tax=Capitella teleta TaxID=283909 RepID=R7TGA3_CAPTE|nr:hypothetical protein CAPTEDRAFT_162923 [Capitella teleta]|eukprot:ELT92522.1 hypothetical protein CAPTEDRAFT_162923 [Capitella teleta]